MILVLGERVSHHFRHWDSSGNNNCGLGESYAHLEMKKIVFDIFKHEGYECFFEEIVVDDDGHKNIIDVLIKRGKRKIAVECQYSGISGSEVRQRTRSLNEKGYPVLWLLDAVSYPATRSVERRVKVPEKFLHRINYGKVFYLNRYKKCISVGKFNKVQRYSEFKGESYYRTLKCSY